MMGPIVCTGSIIYTLLAMNTDNLFKQLEELTIPIETFRHTPVFTCEEAQAITDQLPPHGPIKNLFLKDNNKKMWLIVAVTSTTIRLQELSKKLNAPKLRFASPAELMTHLGVTPGSVSPLALINDTKQTVTVLLDQNLFDYERIGVHPLHNTATTLLAPDDLKKFIISRNNTYMTIHF